MLVDIYFFFIILVENPHNALKKIIIVEFLFFLEQDSNMNIFFAILQRYYSWGSA